jgi:hypothetical protein
MEKITMSTNPNPSKLDASQTIQRAFEEANDAHRVNVIGAISATNPSVSTNGAAIPASSTQVAGKDGSGNLKPISVDTNGNQNVLVMNSLTPVLQDYVAFTIIPSGNGAGQPGTIVYKTGGASGTIVATLGLVYDSNNTLISITRT